LPTPRDLTWIAGHSPYTVNYAGVTPHASFGPDTVPWNYETNPTPVVTVVLTSVPATTVTVDYAVTGGTATADVDYTLPSGALTFAPGEYKKTIPLTILHDDAADDQPVETIEITLIGAAGATLWPAPYNTLTFYIYDVP